jgi:hypothetical protein
VLEFQFDTLDLTSLSGGISDLKPTKEVFG